jgi:hypothetical protein
MAGSLAQEAGAATASQALAKFQPGAINSMESDDIFVVLARYIGSG